MKQQFNFLTAFVLVCLAASCDQDKQVQNATGNISDTMIIRSSVMTKERQEKLTPDAVMADLKQGDQEFVNDQLTVRDNVQHIREGGHGQYPEAVILTCIDSRVLADDVFHKGIGDLFIVRVAGNIVNEDILGSLEYSCKVSGSKLIVVLGHEDCGAVHSAIDGVQLGHITGLLARMQPAVNEAKATFKGDATSHNPEFVEAVCKKNVLLAVDNIRKQSPILKEMEQKGEIKIVGAVYHMGSRKVDLL